MLTKTLTINLPKPHAMQRAFIESDKPRRIIRAGRRGGKTVGISIFAVKMFLAGRRVLYGAPTTDQVQRFWSEVTRALAEPIAAGVFRKNETEHVIEMVGTEQRGVWWALQCWLTITATRHLFIPRPACAAQV
jgi:hypothetical protein